jgi:NTE family protein
VRARRLLLGLLLASAGLRGAAAEPPSFAAQEEDALLTDALWARFRDLPAGKRPKVALVLGGGGARGLSHVGVLKVLARERVPIDMVVGTSVGAIVGALYAAGIPPEEISRMVEEVGWNKLTNLSKAGVVKLLVSEELLSTQKMEGYLQRRFGQKTFADLKVPFACVAADLRTGEQIILREGNLALAARASATMPGVFTPVPYRHRLLVDGGIVDNMPTDVAKLLGADIILCVNVPVDFTRNTTSNVLATLNQALYIQGQVIQNERLSLADVVVEPRVEDVNTFELWKGKECMAAGEAAALKSMPKIRRALVSGFFKAWAGAQP